MALPQVADKIGKLYRKNDCRFRRWRLGTLWGVGMTILLKHAVFGGTIAMAALLASAAPATVTFYTTKASFDAATTTSFLENFSSAPSKNTALASLTLHGVTYTSAAAGANHNVYVAAPGFANFGVAVGVTTDDIMTASGVENIIATFATPYTAIGFNAFFNGLGSGTLSVLGQGQAVLGSLTFADGNDPATHLADKGYLGFVSTDSIYGFQWDTTSGNVRNTGYTNISVGSASSPAPGDVPEPASWMMMAAGFGVVGFATRRRPQRAGSSVAG